MHNMKKLLGITLLAGMAIGTLLWDVAKHAQAERSSTRLRAQRFELRRSFHHVHVRARLDDADSPQQRRRLLHHPHRLGPAEPRLVALRRRAVDLRAGLAVEVEQVERDAGGESSFPIFPGDRDVGGSEPAQAGGRAA